MLFSEYNARDMPLYSAPGELSRSDSFGLFGLSGLRNKYTINPIGLERRHQNEGLKFSSNMRKSSRREPTIVISSTSASHPIGLMTRFVLLTTLLLGCYGPAYAGWVALEKRYQSPGKQTVYFDPDTIRREGNWVSLWQLPDTKWIGEPPTVLSAKTHKQFDCAKGRFWVLAIVEFSREMATGKSASGYIENGNWQQVEPQSVNQALWDAVCKST